MSVPSTLPPLDPFTEDFHQCPFPQLAQLREQAPVHPLTEQGWYMVSTLELARTVLRDSDRFSNQISRRTKPPAEVAEEIAAIRAEGYPYTPTLLTNDPPEHTRYRRMVQQALTPRALAWMDSLIAEVAEELAAGLSGDAEIDFVQEFALTLPAWAISRVLGLPDERRQDVRRWTDAATATIGAQPSVEEWPLIEREMLEFQRAIAAELELRKTDPRDDLLSLLVEAGKNHEPGEKEIGVGELVNLCRELLVAGTESTSRLLADIVWQLDSDAETWARVRDEPPYADRIVEEAVRMVTPSASVLRRVVHDTTLEGVELPAESILVVSLLSANRDESAFDHPDQFDPDREGVSRHISFGQGIHACIGSNLARMEARHAVRALARHCERIDVITDEPLKYIPSLIVRGLIGLRVRVTRR